MKKPHIVLSGSWGAGPPAWRNFIRSLQQESGCYDGWDGLPTYKSHLDVINEALTKYQAVRINTGQYTSEVVFKNESYKTLFLLTYNGPEPEDDAVGMIYAPYIPLIQTGI